MVKVRNQKTRKGKVETAHQTDEIEVYDLQEMKDGFLLEQSCRGNSEATVEYYRGNITRYVEYLEELGLDIDTSSISKEQIKKYMLYLKSSKMWAKTEYIKSEDQLTSKSVQTYIRALKAWTAWMEEEGYLDSAVSSEIKLPKAASKVIEILNEEEIEESFKYLYSKKDNRLRDMMSGCFDLQFHTLVLIEK